MSNITLNNNSWECVIGLEVHAQVISKSKLFSPSASAFGAAPNTQVSLIDAAMPGMLPVLNEYCLHQAIKTGIALNATINKFSAFDRKNYFYPDLPQGYQISQFYFPIVSDGYLDIIMQSSDIIDDVQSEEVKLAKKLEGAQSPDTKLDNIQLDGIKRIRINRIHLEQDAGKSIHDQLSDASIIDLNRSGIALMEIVTEPDIRSPEEATQYIKKLRNILRYIGTCDGNMEQGSLRCDANVSVRKFGQPLGTRCEIKNLNSVRNIAKAIEYEMHRQIDVIESGQVVAQETRLFDVNSGVTRMIRSKEDAHDYRYFPDPDLLPVVIGQELIDILKDELPELPDAKTKRYIEEFGLSKYDAEIIVADIEVAKYFENAIINSKNPKMLANWISTELFARLNKNNITLAESKVTPQMISALVNLIAENIITGKIGKIVFEAMFDSGDDPETIIESRGLVQISDVSELEPIIDKIIKDNPKSVELYRQGQTKILGFFVGQVMKITAGKANPETVNKILSQKLQM